MSSPPRVTMPAPTQNSAAGHDMVADGPNPATIPPSPMSSASDDEAFQLLLEAASSPEAPPAPRDPANPSPRPLEPLPLPLPLVPAHTHSPYSSATADNGHTVNTPIAGSADSGPMLQTLPFSPPPYTSNPPPGHYVPQPQPLFTPDPAQPYFPSPVPSLSTSPPHAQKREREMPGVAGGAGKHHRTDEGARPAPPLPAMAPQAPSFPHADPTVTLTNSLNRLRAELDSRGGCGTSGSLGWRARPPWWRPTAPRCWAPPSRSQAWPMRLGGRLVG